MSRGSSGHQFYITVFSPQGKLYQVEYAFKAVKTANITTVGIRGDDAVVLITQKKVPDKFIDPQSVTNMHSVSRWTGAVMTGLSSDSRNILYRLRLQSAHYKKEFGHIAPVDYIAMRLADYNQINTQKAMQRPFGVQTILCSIDQQRGPSLYKVDPAGYFVGYKAVASGVKQQDAVNYLQKHMKKKGWNLKKNEAIQLAIQTMQSVLGQQFKSSDIQIGVVSTENKQFQKLTEQQIQKYLHVVSRKE